MFENLNDKDENADLQIPQSEQNERQRIEEKIRESEERLRLATEAARMFSWETDLRSQTIKWSENAADLIGCAPEDLPTQTDGALFFVSPNERSRLLKEFRQILQKGETSYIFEFGGETENGGKRFWEAQGSIIYDDKGIASRIVGVTQDVTERQNAAEISDRYRLLLEQARDVVLFVRPDAKIVDANKSATELYGYSRDELLRLSLSDLRIPETLPQLSGQLNEANSGGIRFETFHRRKDGSVFPVEVSSVGADIGGERLLISIIRDISERKSTEAILRESEERFRNMADYAPVMIWMTDHNGACVYLSQSWYEFTGQTPETGLGFGWLDAVHPADSELAEKAFLEANVKGESFRLDYRFRRRDGEYRWAIDSAHPRFAPDGQFLGYIGSVIDITERKITEQALLAGSRQQEALFSLADQMHRSKSLDDVYDAALEAINSALECNRASILLFDESGVMRFVASCGLSETYRRAVDGHSPWKPDEKNAAPISINGIDTADIDDELKSVIKGEGIGALGFIPLISGDALIGKFMVYFNSPHNFSEREFELCLTIARQLVFGLERERAEKELRESEERLRLATEAAQIYSWEYDAANGKASYSANAEEVLGFALPENVEEVNELLHPEDKESALKKFAEGMTGEKPLYSEFRFVNPKNGEVIWLMSQGTLLSDADGAPVRAVGITQNITERKRREANIAFLADITEDFSRLSEPREIVQVVGAKLGAYLGISNCLIAEINEEEDHVFAEYQWRIEGTPDLLGEYRLSEFVKKEFQQAGRAFESIVIRNTQTDQRTDAAAYRAYNIHSFISSPFHRNGKWKYLFTVNHSIARDWRDDEIELVREVTNRIFPRLERARAEAALRESERQLQQMADAMPQVVWIADARGVVTYYNNRVKDFAGIEQNPNGTWDWKPILFEEDLVATVTAWENAVAEKKPYVKEHRIMMKNGEYRWHLSRGFPVFDEIGNISIWYGTATDIHDLKLAGEQVRYQLDLTQSITDNTQMCLLMMDSEGRGTFANPATEKITGFKPEELIGEILHNKIHHTHPDGTPFPITDCPLDNALPLEESVIGYEDVFVHKNGHFYPVRCNGRPIFKDGKPVGTVIEVQDITEEKLAQKALIEAERKAAEEYQALLERIVPLGQTLGTARELLTIYRAILEFVRTSMPCSGFFVSFFDAENRQRHAAYAWGEGVELNIAELPSMPLDEKGGPNSQAVFQKKTVIVNKYWDEQKKRPHLVLQENGIAPMSSLVVPMMVKNEVIGTLEVQAHENEAFSRERAVALEMVANLAAVAIENVRLLEVEASARRAAEESNRAKDDFLAVLSHELRTPLNAMYGWTQILEASDYERETTKQAIEIIARNVRLQNALIEDLLDASRIISGKMRLEPEIVSFVSIVQTAIEAARPAAEKQKVQINFELEPQADELFGDKHRLQQIVGNLLTNAIKFTPVGGNVSVTLKRENDAAKLSIADTGIGISAELLPHIFDRFRQADASSKRKFGGLGLGLTIVKHLVELHGGAISAHSEGEEKGAAFTVELPLAPRQITHADLRASDVENGVKNNKPLANARVLMVDDDRDSLDLMCFVLEQNGARVVCSSSARKALELLQTDDFDLLISDLGMAEMDGYDLIRKVRENENGNGRKLPAIALTGYVSAEDRLRVVEAGFQMHLSKPVNVENLLSVATDLIKKE